MKKIFIIIIITLFSKYLTDLNNPFIEENEYQNRIDFDQEKHFTVFWNIIQPNKIEFGIRAQTKGKLNK
jgi:hypothetical protein